MNANGRIVLVFLALASFCFWIAGCGSNSGNTEAVPVAPTGVTARAGNGQVVINWEPVANANSYCIYGGVTSGVTKNTALRTSVADTAAPTIIGNRHFPLTNGTTYYFVVMALNSLGESVASTEVTATPSVDIPVSSAPTGVIATAGNGQLFISWDPVIDATSYNIYFATTAGVTKTSYTIIGLGGLALQSNKYIVDSFHPET